MEVFNEAFILVFTYHFFCFTDFMPHLENRMLVGKSLVVIAIIDIALNLYVGLQEGASNNLHKMKLLYLKTKMKTRQKSFRGVILYVPITCWKRIKLCLIKKTKIGP